MTRRRVEFVVSIERPKYVSVSALQDYIAEAVGHWGDQFQPPGIHDEYEQGDLLWGIGKTTRVKRYYRPKVGL